ncbi:MAG: NfeD family protein [Thiomargarita sp.]|nr:NfeD family protein [Thiomargarita sp.]
MIQISYWYWWVLASSLLVLEFLLLGTLGSFFLWPAIAAAIIGFLTLLFPMLSLEYQVMILAMVSIVSVMIGRFYVGKHPLSNDQPFLNRRGSELEGNIYPVVEAIENGVGRINVDDSSWRVEGPDCPVATLVRVVVAGDLACLQVDLISEQQSVKQVTKLQSIINNARNR